MPHTWSGFRRKVSISDRVRRASDGGLASPFRSSASAENQGPILTEPAETSSPGNQVATMLGNSAGLAGGLQPYSLLQTPQNSSSFADSTPVWQEKAVLSLDGGGIRGYVSLLILDRLMDDVQDIENNMPAPAEASWDSPLFGSQRTRGDAALDFRPCHYFDYIGGCSTGGLIAILLGRLRFSVKEALETFKAIWGDLVKGRPQHKMLRGYSKSKRTHYSRKTRDTIEKQIRMSPTMAKSDTSVSDDMAHMRFWQDRQLCQTLVLTVMLDKETGERFPHLLSSNSTIAYKDGTSILDVCLATIGAWPYFGSYQMPNDTRRRFKDASRVIANPIQEIDRAIRSQSQSDEIIPSYVVSIGTGVLPTHRATLRRDGARFDGPTVKPGGDEQAYEDIEKMFEQLSQATEKYVEDHRTEIRACAEKLVSRRRERWRTRLWEKYALGVVYRCSTCEKGSIPTEFDREDMVKHLNQHDYDDHGAQSLRFSRYEEKLHDCRRTVR